jgi:hypothetical protein
MPACCSLAAPRKQPAFTPISRGCPSIFVPQPLKQHLHSRLNLLSIYDAAFDKFTTCALALAEDHSGPPLLGMLTNDISQALSLIDPPSIASDSEDHQGKVSTKTQQFIRIRDLVRLLIFAVHSVLNSII